jgi:hypothetical protein
MKKRWYVPVVLVIEAEGRQAAEHRADYILDGMLEIGVEDFAGKCTTGDMLASEASEKWFLLDHMMTERDGEFKVIESFK